MNISPEVWRTMLKISLMPVQCLKVGKCCDAGAPSYSQSGDATQRTLRNLIIMVIFTRDMNDGKFTNSLGSWCGDIFFCFEML